MPATPSCRTLTIFAQTIYTKSPSANRGFPMGLNSHVDYHTYYFFRRWLKFCQRRDLTWSARK